MHSALGLFQVTSVGFALRRISPESILYSDNLFINVFSAYSSTQEVFFVKSATPESYGQEFMRREYTSMYAREKEDSPERSKVSARKIIRSEVNRLSRHGVDLGTVNYLGVGAGKGYTEAGVWHEALSKIGNVTLLDIAKRRPKTVPKKNGKYANVANMEADAMRLPVKDNSTDILSCHMSQDFYPDRDGSTAEFGRVLKPGGLAVVFLHHPQMFRQILEYEPGHAYGRFWRHLMAKEKVFSKKQDIENHYKSHGFDVEKVEEHVPGKNEHKTDYWWEVVLRKKLAK